MQTRKIVQGHIQFNLIQAQTSTKHFNHETESKQATYFKNVKTLASLT